MKTTWNYKKLLGFACMGFFVLIGTYNAVVINSESHLSGADVKFVKRLDELYGETVPGRVVAASTTWKKISPARLNTIKISSNSFKSKSGLSSSVSSNIEVSGSEVTPSAAAVQEELDLNLVEVINPKKWKQGLSANQFSGNIVTNSGVIESLSVSLPNGEGLSVSFMEMSGNVFEYDLNGEMFSGMMYQVDQNAYMVTLTNGPLEGTQLRFASEVSQAEQEQNQQELADNGVEVGNFGEDSNTPVEENNSEIVAQDQDRQMQEEALQAQTYDFNQNESI